jgi:hypothetical protein
MMCHNTGRLPIGIIGFGTGASLPDRMRMPRPPQNKTTFTLRFPSQ